PPRPPLVQLHHRPEGIPGGTPDLRLGRLAPVRRQRHLDQVVRRVRSLLQPPAGEALPLLHVADAHLPRAGAARRPGSLACWLVAYRAGPSAGDREGDAVYMAAAPMRLAPHLPRAVGQRRQVTDAVTGAVGFAEPGMLVADLLAARDTCPDLVARED